MRRGWGRGWLNELAAALAAQTALGGIPGRFTVDVRSRSLAFYPLIGLALGALAAGAAGLVAAAAPRLGGVAAVATLALLTRAAPSRGLAAAAGHTVALAALAAKIWAAGQLPYTALLLPPMLGRWAMVVECYGGSPAAPPARFREFGWASLLAFSLTLSAGEAIGLVLLVAAALATLGLRVLVYRRHGRFTPVELVATGELVETVAFTVLGVLPRLSR